MGVKFIKVVAAWIERGPHSVWWACELPCGHVTNADERRGGKYPVRIKGPCWQCEKGLPGKSA